MALRHRAIPPILDFPHGNRAKAKTGLGNLNPHDVSDEVSAGTYKGSLPLQSANIRNHLRNGFRRVSHFSKQTISATFSGDEHQPTTICEAHVTTSSLHAFVGG
jgi:hypothetical protein